jgi:TIR domain
MADIFLSYAQADRAAAERLAKSLESHGWSVSWDVSLLAGDGFHSKIDEQLRSAQCVVVLWSQHSIESQSAILQAEYGKQRNMLVQALIDDVNPPRGFRQIPAVTPSWDMRGEGIGSLVEGITRLVARPVSASLPALRPERRDQEKPADPLPRDRRVFLCYRRQDTQGHTGRLRDRLVGVYGKDSVFMDVDDVPHGVDFVDYIDSILSTCVLMVVLIGPSWTAIVDRKGRRKLDQPDDLVRAEIASALKRKIPVIPVLVEDAAMPDSDDVPEEIKGLTRRNAIELTHRRWSSDVERVLIAVKRFMEPSRG